MAVLLGVPSESIRGSSTASFSAPQADTSLIARSMAFQEGKLNQTQKLASDIYKISVIAKENEDKAFAQKATNEFRSRVNELWSSTQILKGEDYINAYKTFDKEVDRIRSEIGAKYEDESVRFLYENASGAIAQGVKEQAFAGNVRASYEFRADGLKSALAENVNQFVLDFNDSEKSKKNLETIKNIVGDLADLQGIPKGSAGEKQLYRDSVNQAINASINYQISTKRFGVAGASLEKYKNHMDSATYVSLKATLESRVMAENERLRALAESQRRASNSNGGNIYEYSRDAKTLLYNNYYDQAVSNWTKLNKDNNLNLSEEQIKAKAQYDAVRRVQDDVDALRAKGDLDYIMKTSLLRTVEEVMNDDNLKNSNLSPYEIMQVRSPDDVKYILQSFGSPDAFNTAVSNRIFNVGNESLYNSMTKNGQKGEKLLVFPDESSLGNFMDQKGFNTQERTSMLELYRTVKAKKRSPTDIEKELYLWTVEGEKDIEGLDFSKIDKDLKISVETNVKMAVVQEAYSQQEYQYRQNMGIPFDQTLTPQQQNDVKLLTWQKKNQINNEIETRLKEIDTTAEQNEELLELDSERYNRLRRKAIEALIQQNSATPNQDQIIHKMYEMMIDENEANNGSSVFHYRKNGETIDNAREVFTSMPHYR